jgi:hypothetical protein
MNLFNAFLSAVRRYLTMTPNEREDFRDNQRREPLMDTWRREKERARIEQRYREAEGDNHAV